MSPLTYTMDQHRLPYPFKISGIKSENDYTKTFVLDGPLKADPGQFVMAWLPDYQDKPFSLAGTDPVKLTIAAVGPLSRAFHQLTIGDPLWLRGPLGRGYQLPDTPAHILLIGGGYGVAPLLFLAQQAQQKGHQVSAIIGARSGANLLLVQEFNAIDVSLWLTTEDGSAGQQGVVTQAIPLVLANSSARPHSVYSCGPTGMLQAVAAFCEAENIPVQVSWEAYMRCAIGLCGSCEAGPGWLTCLDGPVFPFNPLQTSPPGG